nr:hypothetical protein [uncultured Bacteroides sp.]
MPKRPYGETGRLPAGRPAVCLREDRLSACGKTGHLPAGRQDAKPGLRGTTVPVRQVKDKG